MKLVNGCGCSAAIRVLRRFKLEEYSKTMHSLSHYDSSTFTQKNSIFSDFMLFITDTRSWYSNRWILRQFGSRALLQRKGIIIVFNFFFHTSYSSIAEPCSFKWDLKSAMLFLNWFFTGKRCFNPIWNCTFPEP